MGDNLTVQAGKKREVVQHIKFGECIGLFCIDIFYYIPIIVSFTIIFQMFNL